MDAGREHRLHAARAELDDRLSGPVDVRILELQVLRDVREIEPMRRTLRCAAEPSWRSRQEVRSQEESLGAIDVDIDQASGRFSEDDSDVLRDAVEILPGVFLCDLKLGPACDRRSFFSERDRYRSPPEFDVLDCEIKNRNGETSGAERTAGPWTLNFSSRPRQESCTTRKLLLHVPLMARETDDVMVATRVSKPLYAKILKRQRELKRLTGIEPSVSAVLRVMIAEADEPRRRRHRAA